MINTYSDLFKSKTLLKVSFKTGFIWIVTTLTYYKLAIGENKGGLLIDNVLAGVIELACLFPGGWLIQQKWCQRRWFLGMTFFIAAVGISLDTLFTQLYVNNSVIMYQLKTDNFGVKFGTIRERPLIRLQ